MGKFVIRRVATGIKFNLKASNGQIILTSKIYTSPDACRKGIDSVVRNAPIAGFEDQTAEGFALQPNPKFEMYRDRSGGYRFRLKARNGEIIGASEGYVNKTGCINGIDSVRTNTPDAQIYEE